MSARTAIIIAVVLVLLFFAALGAGVSQDSDTHISNSFTDAIGGLSNFAPSASLVGKCNGERLRTAFRLNAENDSCTFLVRPRKDEKYGIAKLHIIGPPGLASYVWAEFNSDRFSIADRDPDRCVIPGLPGAALAPHRLEIRLESDNDSDEESWTCWYLQKSNQAIDITVTGDGGDLTLSCRGCDQNGSGPLKLLMR